MATLEVKAYKFNASSTTNLSDLSENRIYQLNAKIQRGERLTKDEKLYITKRCMDNSYSKLGVPILGWFFSFDSVIKTYLVKQYGCWNEYHAVNKTCLRALVIGRIDKIVEVK